MLAEKVETLKKKTCLLVKFKKGTFPLPIVKKPKCHQPNEVLIQQQTERKCTNVVDSRRISAQLVQGNGSSEWILFERKKKEARTSAANSCSSLVSPLAGHSIFTLPVRSPRHLAHLPPPVSYHLAHRPRASASSEAGAATQ